MKSNFAQSLDSANKLLIKENTQVDRRIAFTSLIEYLSLRGVNIVSKNPETFTLEVSGEGQTVNLTVNGHSYTGNSGIEPGMDNQEDQEEVSPIAAARDITGHGPRVRGHGSGVTGQGSGVTGQDPNAPEESQVRRSYSNLMRTVQGRIDDITRKLH
jgi:hypothetical protein